MSTCTWDPAHRHPVPRSTRRRGGAVQHLCCSTNPLDAVLRRVGRGTTMTVAELRHAARVLGRHAPSGRMEVLVAQVRVAVRLERLGG